MEPLQPLPMKSSLAVPRTNKHKRQPPVQAASSERPAVIMLSDVLMMVMFSLVLIGLLLLMMLMLLLVFVLQLLKWASPDVAVGVWCLCCRC